MKAAISDRLAWWTIEYGVKPCAIAGSFVLVALLWTFPLQRVIAYPFVFLFFGAIMGSAWFGGIIAGAVAVLLSSFLGRTEITNAMSSSRLRRFDLIAETEATLRPFLSRAAEAFSESKTETANRSIRKDKGEWHKLLLTYRLNGD